MVETVCIRKCFSGGNLYNEGDKRNFADGEKIPSHFEPLEKHEEKVKEKKEAEEKTVTDLQEELERYNKQYDKRWGRARLEQELVTVKKDILNKPKPKE